MNILLLKEIKQGETRVAMMPDDVADLFVNGHAVFLVPGAGVLSGFSDEDYVRCSSDRPKKGVIVPELVFDTDLADLVVKVKEPLPEEFHLFREGQMLFTFLHLAANRELTEFLLEKKITAIDYATIATDDGFMPILRPMSDIAGRLAVQIGAYYLQSDQGGKGVLFSRAGGDISLKPPRITILGGGVAGTAAAHVAHRHEADIAIFDINPEKLQILKKRFSDSVQLYDLNIDSNALPKRIEQTDLLIGAVLIPGAAASKLVTKEMVMSMEKGSVVVDISIDQGGCVETTTCGSHKNPVSVRHDVIHYAVPNMPALVGRTATHCLTEASFPYIKALANNGFKNLVKRNSLFARGVNTYNGHVTHSAVAEAFGMEYVPLESLL